MVGGEDGAASGRDVLVAGDLGPPQAVQERANDDPGNAVLHSALHAAQSSARLKRYPGRAAAGAPGTAVALSRDGQEVRSIAVCWGPAGLVSPAPGATANHREAYPPPDDAKYERSQGADRAMASVSSSVSR